MKKYIILSFSLLLAIGICSKGISKTIAELKQSLNKNSAAIKSSARPIIDIQNIYKGRVRGWRWSKGEGTASVLAITIKFKLREKGQSIHLPHICVYLFSREKAQIKKITDFFYKTTTGNIKAENNPSFKGNKTYQLQFPYNIGDKFRYAIAIIGDNANCSYITLPRNTPLNDFEFTEKHLLKQD